MFKIEMTALRTLIVTFDSIHYSNTVCLKDLTVLVRRQHKLWNDEQLRIAMVTASAGTLL